MGVKCTSQIMAFEITIVRDIGTGDVHNFLPELQEGIIRFAAEGHQTEAKSDWIHSEIFRADRDCKLGLEELVQFTLKLADRLVILLEKPLDGAVDREAIRRRKTKLLAKQMMDL